MKHLFKYIAGLMLMAMASVSVHAQDAFYVYQNDGHFDGFFYDEVEKIRYSKTDTLGFEHEVFVSQEIVTADSTYRFMLTAIDSIGFVQPEIIFNPQLHKLGRSIRSNGNISYYYSDKSSNYQMVQFEYDAEALTLTFDKMYTTSEFWPKVNDVFVYTGVNDNNIWDSWGVKVARIEEQNYFVVAHCKPIEDITDIFQQLVCVEEYGYRPDGELTRQRIASRPDLTVDKRPNTRASSGKWEGDLFNFSINAHIPLYDKDDLNISINPSIEGKLNVKATWNLSLLGEKYIGITTQLNFGVGCGFSIDGKIKDFFPSGIGGLLGGVPIPATCPIIYLDIAPDAFIRGEAHVNFNLSSPTLNGAMWSRLEINNWIPSMKIGFKNADNSKFETIKKSSAGAKLSLNGFVQSGMLFPMKFKSLPLIQKIFDSEIGGQWFVGPKMAGNISIDLTTNPLDELATYNLLKNTTISFHMLDADYEVKAKVKTLLSGTKEVTLADGSFNIFPPLDVALAPEFSDCTETYEDRNGIPCRVFTFTPQGAVLMPTYIGARLCKVNGDGTEGMYYQQENKVPYYHIHQMMGKPVPKEMCAEYVLRYDRFLDPEILNGGKFRVRPFVRSVLGEVAAGPVYEFEEGNVALLSSDSLIVENDGTCDHPIMVTGNCTDILLAIEGRFNDTQDNMPYVKVANKDKGTFEIYFDKEAFNKDFGKYYGINDSIKINYSLKGTVKGSVFDPTIQTFTVVILPNKEEQPLPEFEVNDHSYSNPHTNYYDMSSDLYKLTDFSITRSTEDPMHWKLTGKAEASDNYHTGTAIISFDLVMRQYAQDPSSFYWRRNLSPIEFEIENGSYLLEEKSKYNENIIKVTGTFKSERSVDFDSVTGHIGQFQCESSLKEGVNSQTPVNVFHTLHIGNIHFKDNFGN